MKTIKQFIKTTLAILFCIGANGLYAQDLEWAKSFGGEQNEVGNSITVDESGNIYTTGHFKGTADFDPGEGTFNLTSVGDYDIFIQKLDASGNFLWAKSFGSIWDDYGNSITVDVLGNVYTTGYFWQTVDFDPGPGTVNLTSAGNRDVFVQKLDASGNLIWAKSFGNSGTVIGRSITVNPSGYVYTTGEFYGTVDFDPGEGTFNLTSAGITDVFIQKLGFSGNFLWAKSFGGNIDDNVEAITSDLWGNVYTTGYFRGTADFDPGTGTANHTVAGQYDGFVQKLDVNGNFLWSKSFGDESLDRGNSITVDATGNVFTTGYGTVDLISAGGGDSFVQKMDASGNLLWAKSFGGNYGSEGNSIAVDTFGNVYTTGTFSTTADLDPGEGTFELSGNLNEVFIQKLDSSGDFVWAKSLGGIYSDVGQGIKVDAAGNIYSVGYFRGSAEFDPGEGIAVLTSVGFNDVFILKMNNSGCTDLDACNYNPEATAENNSCCYTWGCTVPGASNYNPLACCDDGTCRFPIIGTVFFDENENGVKDGNESGLPFQEVELLPNGFSLTTNVNGHFLVNASGSDEFTFTLAENPLFPFFTTPQSLTFDATQDNWNQDTLYFGVSNEIPAFDLEADLYSVINGFPCNNNRAYYLCFRNTSNNTVDAQVEFHYDSLFQGITESALIDSLGENVAYLSFTDVAPMELVCLQVELLSPTVEFIGEFLETSIEITAFYDGEEVAFGADSLSDELTCAYDPNDKQVFPVGYSEEHYIANDTTLEYLIRFQNTGNAPATDVIVRDTLDEHLDLSTFQLRVSSHSVFTTLDPTTHEVEFYFQNIMLLDSVNNEPESHGLVSFTIQPEAELPLLTELNNTAAIYFDNNPPIITNTTWSTIYDCSLFEVSFTDNGALLTASAGDSYQWFLDGEPIDGATEQQYTALENGNYSVQVDNDFPCTETSNSTFIVVTSIKEWEGREIKLFPNPMTTSATLDLGELRGPIQIEIYDILGKLHRSEVLSVESGTLTLKRGDLTKGVYILRLTLDTEPVELKFLVE